MAIKIMGLTSNHDILVCKADGSYLPFSVGTSLERDAICFSTIDLMNTERYLDMATAKPVKKSKQTFRHAPYGSKPEFTRGVV
jgi:hypothetical protein